MTTHSNTLPWEIPWTEGPGGLQFMGSQRVSTTQGNRAGWETSLNLCSILNCSSALTRQQYTINGCFHNTIADMSSLNRESMTSKAKDLLFDPLQKTFPKPYCRVWLTIIF